MKKLMTTLSAIAVAIGLHAVGMGDTGTSFEGIEIPLGGSSVPYDIFSTGDVGEGGEIVAPSAGNSFWETNDTATLTVVAGDNEYAHRPDQFSDKDQYRYLSVKTTLGNPVTRYAKDDKTGTEIGSGYYFDSLVKFTAFDSDPTGLFADDDGRTVITNGGKIAIWLKENIDPVTELPTSTNLMITAGYLVDDSVVATNYECEVIGDNINLNDGGWHRVTVMAIDNIYTDTPTVPGFIVYIDRSYVGSKGDSTKGIDPNRLDSFYYGFNVDKAVFPSAVQGGVAKSSIKAVDFDGQGDVDDLVFTTDRPTFIKEVECFTVALGDGVESVVLDTRDMSGHQIAQGCGTFTSGLTLKYEEGMSVTISDIDYVDGYIDGGVATNGNVAVDSEDSSKYLPLEGNTGIEIAAKRLGATVIIGDVTNTFETVEQAIAEKINDPLFSGSAKIVLNADATDGVLLTNANASVELDLAGSDITGVAGVADGAAITVKAGALLVTNSTVEVGHVVGVPADVGEPAIAVAVDAGFVTLAGGYFDGYVTCDPECVAITGDAKIRIAENFEYLADLKTCVIPDGYTLEEESGESPVYYVVVEGTVTTVTVNFINGELIVATTNVEIGATLVAPAAPEKAGHTFRAWVTTDDPAEDWDFENDTVAGAMSLIADFTVNQYAVTFDSDDGSYTPEGEMVDYGDTATEPVPDPTKDGYTFKFWSLQGETTEYDFTTPVTGAITLVAQWEADEYTITYLYDDGAAFSAWADNYTAPAKYTVEHDVTLPVAGDLKLGTGVTFQGWTNETGDVTGWLAGAKTGPVTVYAKLEVVGPTPTITPGTGVTTVEVEATDSADAISKVVIVPPTGSGIDTAEEQAAYVALFDITAEADSGKPGYYNVSIAGIKDSVVTGVNTDAVAVFSGDTSVTIPQGLYYRITPSTSLPIASVGAGVVSDGSAITVTKPGTTQGFLKVELSASPIPAPAAD